MKKFDMGVQWKIWFLGNLQSSFIIHFNQLYSWIILLPQTNMKDFNKLFLDKSINLGFFWEKAA